MSLARRPACPVWQGDPNINLEKGTVPEMSEAQRRCLLHVLRNVASGLMGTISLLEGRGSMPTQKTLISCLKGIPQLVQRVITALEAGSFCTLTKEECQFVGPHVGCMTAPTPSELEKSSNQELAR